MEWQAIVLTSQIMLLAVGWALFQKARAELAARAAEAPILSEVRASRSEGLTQSKDPTITDVYDDWQA